MRAPRLIIPRVCGLRHRAHSNNLQGRVKSAETADSRAAVLSSPTIPTQHRCSCSATSDVRTARCCARCLPRVASRRSLPPIRCDRNPNPGPAPSAAAPAAAAAARKSTRSFAGCTNQTSSTRIHADCAQLSQAVGISLHHLFRAPHRPLTAARSSPRCIEHTRPTHAGHSLHNAHRAARLSHRCRRSRPLRAPLNPTSALPVHHWPCRAPPPPAYHNVRPLRNPHE